MGLFSRTKTSDPPPASAPAQNSGKKIILNFGDRATKAVLDMAAAMLKAGGYIDPPPREPEIGDKMPDGTVYAGLSPDTGKAMYTTTADAPLTYTFNEAKEYAARLDAKDLDEHGHGKGWRVPSKAELNVLFNNRAAIGGFNVTGSSPGGWYCSSSSYSSWVAWAQRFCDGYQVNYLKVFPSSARCVR